MLVLIMITQAGGSRLGDLSLRQQRLTQPMLRALRTETTRVQMDLLQYDSDDEEQEPTIVHRRGGKVYTQPNEFAHLRIRVTNLSRE